MTFTEYHDAILAAVRAEFGANVATVEAYDETILGKLETPAVLLAIDGTRFEDRFWECEVHLLCCLNRKTNREHVELHEFAAQMAELVEENDFGAETASNPTEINTSPSGLPEPAIVVRDVEFIQRVNIDKFNPAALSDWITYHSEKAMGGNEAPVAEDTVTLPQ